MIWLLLLLPCSPYAAAQTELELKAIKELEDRLPRNENEIREALLDPRRQRFLDASVEVRWSEIIKSGTEYISIREGSTLFHLPSQHNVGVLRHIYARVYRRADDLGYKYLIGADGKVEYAVLASDVQSIQSVTDLHRHPHVYTPATVRPRQEFDGQLRISPELRFSAGIARGAFFQDLFNERSTVSGYSTHYAVSVLSRWSLPIKVGLGLNYESSIYDLSAGGTVRYTSASVGPIFQTRDLDLFFPMRFLAQFRFSPFSQMVSSTRFGNFGFRFNSSDLFLAAEVPHRNGWGEFLSGLFVTSQWLSIRNQGLPVDLRANTDANVAFGFTLSQAFQ